MYTLFWSVDTGAFGVQAVLEELGALPVRGLDTSQGQHRTPHYLAVNPMAQVPALRLPDGTVITELAAIVLHLCDAQPEAGAAASGGHSARAPPIAGCSGLPPASTRPTCASITPSATPATRRVRRA